MKERGSFGSKFGIVAAAAGSAIGLGNIWRFPYLAGENGGGAFLIIYLAIVLVIGTPMMLAEFSIGRAARRSVFGAFNVLRPRSVWSSIGVLGVATAFVILIFYTVVSGWTMSFLWDSVLDRFDGLSSVGVKAAHDAFVASGWQPIGWAIAFASITGVIVIGGVEKGIERYNKILMPLMVLILIGMGIYSTTLPGFGAGMRFLFNPDFSKVDGPMLLEALGQAFFSLSLGMGVMITYGSYIKQKDNMASTVASVAVSDTLIAMLAGVAIFPAVFSFSISPTSGPDLVFITLPALFQQMTGGYVISILFFALLLIAALTSAVSIMEVLTAWCVEEFKMSRRKAGICMTFIIAALASVCAVSQMPGSSLHIGGRNLFAFFDHISAAWMLPVGAFFITLFAGWFWGRRHFRDQVTNEGIYNVCIWPVVWFIVRFVAPLVIVLVFLSTAGLLKI